MATKSEFDQKKLFADLEQLLSGNLSTTLIFIKREKSNSHKKLYYFKKVLLSQDVQESFRKSFHGKIGSISKNIDKKVFEEYSPTNTLDSIKYVREDDLEQTLLNLDKNNVETIKDGDLNSEFFEKLWGYIVIFEDGSGKSVRIFKRYTPGNVLRKSLLGALIIKEGMFTKIDRDIFKMDYKIHCFLFGGYVIIFSKKSFEQLFNLGQLFEKESKAVLEEIGKMDVKITNWDDFKMKCCENINMMRKLSNIRATGGHKYITFSKIKTMKRSYKLRFGIDERTKSIIYASYLDIWDILALFDDDLLKSELTKKKYEAPAKRER